MKGPSAGERAQEVCKWLGYAAERAWPRDYRRTREACTLWSNTHDSYINHDYRVLSQVEPDPLGLRAEFLYKAFGHIATSPTLSTRDRGWAHIGRNLLEHKYSELIGTDPLEDRMSALDEQLAVILRETPGPVEMHRN